ncbi:hypothetical protein MTO96_013912 [Rhipicephalus appendiculatus]
MIRVVVVRKTTFLSSPSPSDPSGCRHPFSSGPDVRSRSHVGPKRKPLFWPIQRVVGHLKELFPSGPLGLEHGEGGRRSDMGTELSLRNSSFAPGPPLSLRTSKSGIRGALFATSPRFPVLFFFPGSPVVFTQPRDPGP